MAETMSGQVWDATAAKVALWRSDRGSSSAGLGGEDLFLALRVAIAAAAPLASPAQSLFWFIGIGALLACLRFVIGSLPLAGGEGLPLAVGPLVPWSAAPTSMGLPLPPLCISSVIRLSVHDCLRCHAAADATMLVAQRLRALEFSNELGDAWRMLRHDAEGLRERSRGRVACPAREAQSESQY